MEAFSNDFEARPPARREDRLDLAGVLKERNRFQVRRRQVQ
jgi:hypothetical protein